MTICATRNCNHSAPTLSKFELDELKSQQHTANNERHVLTYSRSTQSLVPWSFPCDRRVLKRGPPGFLSLSTMYREWGSAMSSIAVLFCYCDRPAQMGYSNGNGGKYYFTCDCFNPRLDDTQDRNASNKCGFQGLALGSESQRFKRISHCRILQPDNNANRDTTQSTLARQLAICCPGLYTAKPKEKCTRYTGLGQSLLAGKGLLRTSVLGIRHPPRQCTRAGRGILPRYGHSLSLWTMGYSPLP